MKKSVVVWHRLVLGLLLGLACQAGQAAPVVLVSVDAGRPGATINPAMWGVFFEDINFGADGGLYADLVKNRSFEFTQPMMGWKRTESAGVKGVVEVVDKTPLNGNNPHYLRVSLPSDAQGLGLINEGFAGMGIRSGERYRFTVWARSPGSAPTLRIELQSADGTTIASGKISGIGEEWNKYGATLKASATEPKARLVLSFEGAGTVDVDMVSLFPIRTWKNRPGGLRADLVQMLADLKPGFVRFPGGCIVEGHYLTNRYQWKTTIGRPEERRLIMNRWNDEFKHRPAPDYFQSFGLGFYEYFLMCEDIGAEPLPILNCGMACQFNSGELASLSELDPYIQDALDLIEFANGASSTPWGSKRAAMGHRKPFGMKMLGIGNEQWGPEYVERYAAFAKVLKQKHPEIQLISSAGPGPDDERFHFLWPKLKELKADIIDEHCYANPEWFLNNAGRYDRRERTGPKVFMGEYAAQSVKTVSPENRNNWGTALAEAAYLTGLERNADLVVMASYAPLFAHVDLWQWRPNLIWFDNLKVFGTPNYYVQQLFSRNRGDRVLPVEIKGELLQEEGHIRFFASATRDVKEGEVVLKIVNPLCTPVELRIALAGVKKVGSKAEATVLTSANMSDENSLENPRLIYPTEERVSGVSSTFSYLVKAQSVTMLRIPAR